MSRLTKVSVIVEGVDEKGQPFKEEMVLEGEIDGNWEQQFGTATGWKSGRLDPVDVVYTGESRLKLDLHAVNSKTRYEYAAWASGMFDVKERMG